MLSGKLNVSKAKSLSAPGRYGDGGGLHLLIQKDGRKSWVLRTTVHGRRRDLGLGGISYVSLAQARIEALRLRTIARNGGDPLAERNKEVLTFGQAAERVFEQSRPTWKNAKHAEQWINTLRTYAFPFFGDIQIANVTSANVLEALTPIWTSKPETAKRLKQRISTVFDWAKSAGHYPNENPVAGLKKALPDNRVQPKHHASLPWPELPEFMERLSSREGVSAYCLRFIILTAVRSGEARGATWSEIDGNKWIIPAQRMKAAKAYRIPLSPEALAVLDEVRGLDGDLIFPSTRKRPLSVMAFKALFKRMGVDAITTHGFRSTFRDWCSESAHIPREVAEAALAHKTGDATEQSYARSDLFERRIDVMDQWSAYATNRKGSVLQFSARALNE